MAPSKKSSSRSMMVSVDDDHHNDDGAAQEALELRRGPWTVEEDLALVNYITSHGEGRWNNLAQAAGLKRTGKSCRLRWLNYLRPDVKRGNFTADEQLLILDLHSRYGNRWSKIAQHLPGRTDNEIKNYWRTRVQKHAKQLNCDANSKRFKDAMRYLWMPHLVDAVDPRLLLQADQEAGYYSSNNAALALSGVGVAVTSSSSDESSYDAFPKKWEPSSSTSYSAGDPYANNVGAGGDHQVQVNGAGEDCWVQEMNFQQAVLQWPEESKPAQVLVNGGGAGHLFEDAELSGWVQSFSEGIATENFWTLEDIWKMQ